MAPIIMACEALGCGYTTAEFEPEVAIRVLELHQQNTHVQVQQPPQVGGQAASAKPRFEKVPSRVVLRQNTVSHERENGQPSKSWSCQNHSRSCLIVIFIHEVGNFAK